MSNLLVRVKKGKCPFKKPLTDSTYKNAKPYLKKEFDARCCYSMLHCDLAGGDKSMEVEHFRPKKKFSKKPHAYSNLLYCSRHCNGSKWNTWPTYKELQA